MRVVAKLCAQTLSGRKYTPGLIGTKPRLICLNGCHVGVYLILPDDGFCVATHGVTSGWGGCPLLWDGHQATEARYSQSISAPSPTLRSHLCLSMTLCRCWRLPRSSLLCLMPRSTGTDLSPPVVRSASLRYCRGRDLLPPNDPNIFNLQRDFLRRFMIKTQLWN